MTKTKSIIFAMVSAVLCMAVALIFCGFITQETAYAQEIEPCEHDYEETAVEATCTEMGYALYKCKNCGDSYQDEFTEAKGHNYTLIVVEATCTERGFTTHLCVDCGHNYTDSVVVQLGHKYIVEEYKATCKKNGYTLHTCATCNDTYIDNNVEAFGHNYVEKEMAATCNAYGFTLHECESCGDKYITDYVRPTGHSFVDTIIEATKETVGYTYHRCTECEYSYLSDFVRSGEQPTFPESGETGEPENPNEPDQQPDIPDHQPTDPVEGDNEQCEHTHNYFLYNEQNDDERYILIKYFCSGCEDVKTEEIQVTFTSEDGERFDLVADVEGKVDYAYIPVGAYSVEMFNGAGQTLIYFEMTIEERGISDEPTVESETPDGPNEPTEPEQPDEPTDSDKLSEGEQSTGINVEKFKQKGNSGLFIGLVVALFVLGAGAVTTFIILKKKNKKNKNEVK